MCFQNNFVHFKGAGTVRPATKTHSPTNAIDTGFLNIYIRNSFTEKE